MRFASRTLFVTEAYSGPLIEVMRDHTNALASVELKVIGGSAVEGQDYTLSPKVAVFQPGVSCVGITLTVAPEGQEESVENIELILTNATVGLLPDWPAQCTITLDDSPPGFEFAAYQPGILTGRECWGPYPISVQRRGDLSSSASVEFRIEPITARPGVDYTPVSDTLCFSPGSSSASFSIPFIDNNSFDGTRALRVFLTNASPGFIIRQWSSFTLNIQDDEGFAMRAHGAPWMEYYDATICENAGEAPVEVFIRGPAPTAPATVEYHTESLVSQGFPYAAIPGQDYVQTQGTLSFGPGETNRIVHIPIINNTRVDTWGQRMFVLVLSNPTGGVFLSPSSELTIAISDNETLFSLDNMSVDESARTVTLNVRQMGDYDYTRTVHYFVASTNLHEQSGSATRGLDFVPAEGTLIFGPGVTNQSLTLTILDDDLIEPDENFFVVLDRPTGVGAPDWWSQASVTIRDDEVHPPPPATNTVVNFTRVDPDFKPEWPRPYAFAAGPPAVQPDGKILLATPALRLIGEYGSLIVRILPDGQPDPAWHAPLIEGQVSCLATLTDGQILVAADSRENPDNFSSAQPVFNVNSVTCHHLARLGADGSLDTGFRPVVPFDSVVVGVVGQADGKILAVLAGEMTGGQLLRLNQDGSPAPWPDGSTYRDVPIQYWGAEILLPADGGVLVQGRWPSDPGVRFRPDGTLDDQFPAYHFMLQPDGRLLANTSEALVRLTSDGHLDPNFAPIPLEQSHALGSLDGKIWLLSCRESTAGLTWSWHLSRRNADGTEDASFGSTEVWISTYSILSEEWLALPGGDLLVCGYFRTTVNGQPRRALARLSGNAPIRRFEVGWDSAVFPEKAGTVPVKIVRCGPNDHQVTIEWWTEGGTARPSVDYVQASGTLSFATNEYLASLELQLIDNTVPDGDRTVRIRLRDANSGGAEYPFLEVTIVNDDVGFLPQGINRFANGRVLLRATGIVYSSSVEASSDLSNWSGLDLISAANAELVDSNAPGNPQRFYRLAY